MTTRVRIDPSFIEDPRWERLGAEAFCLHMAALSFVNRTHSDGFVSSARAAHLSPMVKRATRTIRALLDDDVWRATEGGYIVCAVGEDLRQRDIRGDEQPSSTFVENERRLARERKERWRAGRNGDGNGVPNAAQASAGQARPVLRGAVQEPCPAPALPAEAKDAAGPVLPEVWQTQKEELRRRRVAR